MQNNYQVADTILETHFGAFQFHCFSWGKHEEDNVLCLSRPWETDSPLVRVQSACYTAEIFRSLDCDCHEQLEESLRRIQSQGGILVYMLCDGRGTGLLQKVKGLELGRTQGLDTSDVCQVLGLDQDPRDYERVAAVLQRLNACSIRLLTNNPRKVDGLRHHGINAMREPLEIIATAHSRAYLEAKKRKMGHLLMQFPDDPLK